MRNALMLSFALISSVLSGQAIAKQNSEILTLEEKVEALQPSSETVVKEYRVSSKITIQHLSANRQKNKNYSTVGGLIQTIYRGAHISWGLLKDTVRKRKNRIRRS